MNVILVAGRFPQRSETFIYRKAVALARLGHHVTVLSRKPGEWNLYPDPLPPTLVVENLPADTDLRAPRRLANALVHSARYAARAPRAAWALFSDGDRASAHSRLARYLPFVHRDAAVLHFEFLGVGAMYSRVREVTNLPIVVSCRGYDVHMIEQHAPAKREAMLACLRDADAVHCVSDEMAREVERVSGRSNGLWVNRPAVDVDHIRARDPRTTAGPLRIIATGRLVWKKGFDYLLAALATLARRGVDFRAEILGDGELHKSLRFSIDDLGLGGRVSLPGAISSKEVLERMQASDLFVLSSHEEGISNAALEAMASGLPVVTTTAGGMAEAVRDGVDGFVVPVRDPDALARQIEAIARDVELRIALGRNARARAESEFSLHRQAARFVELYEAVARVR